MKIITYDMLKEQFVRLAEERPDFVYTLPQASSNVSCKYLHADGPGCIVGHALHRLGVSPYTLARMDAQYAGSNIDICSGTLESDGYALTEDARELAGEVQGRQDNGRPWGKAVDHALGMLR